MATHHAKLPALTGRRILICRPDPDASRLAGQFRETGAEVRLLPTIARTPLPESPEIRTLIQDLDHFHHIIAVSPYAASLLLALIEAWWPQIPVGIRWYGVGKATAAVFADAGLEPVAPPSGWTSEDLLAVPQLATPEGERVLLVRGEDGRELMRETLTARGARVTPLALYRRSCPDYDQTDLDSALAAFRPDAVITLSGETLNNLIALGKNTNHNLQEAVLLVPADRVAEQARAAGFNRICIPESLADPDIVAAVARQLSPDHP